MTNLTVSSLISLLKHSWEALVEKNVVKKGKRLDIW